MIAASVKDGEKIVDLLLSKGADVNEKSRSPSGGVLRVLLTNSQQTIAAR